MGMHFIAPEIKHNLSKNRLVKEAKTGMKDLISQQKIRRESSLSAHFNHVRYQTGLQRPK